MLTTHLALMNGKSCYSWRRIVVGGTLSVRFSRINRIKESDVHSWSNTSLETFRHFGLLHTKLSLNKSEFNLRTAVVTCKRSVADYAKTNQFTSSNSTSFKPEQHGNEDKEKLFTPQIAGSLADSQVRKVDEQNNNTQECERTGNRTDNDNGNGNVFTSENTDNNSTDESINEEQLTVIVNEVVELLKRNGPLPISRLSSQLSEEILEEVSCFKGALVEVCSMFDETFIIETLAGGIRVVMLRSIIDHIGAAELQRNYYNRSTFSSGKSNKRNNLSNTNEQEGDLEIANVTDADRALLARVVALFTAAMYFPRKVPNGLPSSNPRMEEVYNSLRATIIYETESARCDTSSTFSTTSSSSSSSASLTLKTLGSLNHVADKLHACPSFFETNNINDKIRFHRRITISASQSELISKRRKSKKIVLNYLQAKQGVLTKHTTREENKKQPLLKFEDGKLVTVSYMQSKANAMEPNKTVENRLTRVLREIVPRTFFVPLTHLMSDKRAYLYFDVKDKLEIVANELKLYGKNVVDLRSFKCKVRKTTELPTEPPKSNNEKMQSSTMVTHCTSEEPFATSSSSLSLSSSAEESETCEKVKSMYSCKLSKLGQEKKEEERMHEDKKTEQVESIVFARLIDSSISNNMLASDYGELEVNCLEYNIFALGSRIIQEFNAKLKQEPQLKLRCIKGIAMNELHDILSPSLLNDMTSFFTSCMLTSRRRYEQQLQLQRRQVEQERLYEQKQQQQEKEKKPEQEVQQRENWEDATRDGKDCISINTQEELEIDETVFILIFDRLRHYFDVNFNINSVRPWSVLTEDLQPSSLTTETTTLPLVLRALRQALSDEPLSLEQLYHGISNLCKIELLALYDNPEWIKWNAHDKSESEIENELRKVSTERAVKIMKLFVSSHSLYVRHDANDDLVYTPLLTAAALQKKYMTTKKKEYEALNKLNRSCISDTDVHDEVDDKNTHVNTTHSHDAAKVDINTTSENNHDNSENPDVVRTFTKSSNNDDGSNAHDDKCKNSVMSDNSYNNNKNDHGATKKSNLSSSNKQTTHTSSSSTISNPQRSERHPYDRFLINVPAVKGPALETAETLMNVLPRNQAILRNCVNGLIKGTSLQLSYIQKRETYTRYPTLFRTYQPFASHLELVSRADIPPPPEDTLQPKRCTVEMLIKYMALQTIHGGVDGTVMNIISEEGRQVMKSIGNFADIAQQLPMWFEVRRDTHSSNGSMITYIGGASDKVGNRFKGVSDDMACNEFWSEDACDNNSIKDNELKEESVEEVRKRLGMRRIVNGTLEPVDEFGDDEHFLNDGKWDPEWGEEDERRYERKANSDEDIAI